MEHLGKVLVDILTTIFWKKNMTCWSSGASFQSSTHIIHYAYIVSSHLQKKHQMGLDDIPKSPHPRTPKPNGKMKLFNPQYMGEIYNP